MYCPLYTVLSCSPLIYGMRFFLCVGLYFQCVTDITATFAAFPYQPCSVTLQSHIRLCIENKFDLI